MCGMVKTVQLSSLIELLQGAKPMNTASAASKTWHRKVYNFTYFFSKEKPKQTSLCRYFWRIILMPIPVSLVILLAMILLFVVVVFIVIVAIVLLVANNLFYIGIGKGVASLDMTESKNFIKVREFKAFTVAGRKIRSVKIMLGFWATILVVAGSILLYHLTPNATALLSRTTIVVVLIAAYFLFVALSAGASRARRSDTAKLIKDYLQARKDKVCPIISLED
jgi:hypothetical protein